MKHKERILFGCLWLALILISLWMGMEVAE